MSSLSNTDSHAIRRKPGLISFDAPGRTVIRPATSSPPTAAQTNQTRCRSGLVTFNWSTCSGTLSTIVCSTGFTITEVLAESADPAFIVLHRDHRARAQC